MSGSHIPSASGPFSALTPSMWPQEILAKYTQKEEAVEQPGICYDEFGFRMDKEGRCLEVKSWAWSSCHGAVVNESD
uniref:Small G protein signaling modulator 3 n=1 Tax=Sus scrofa TaxID=9823 RepID=A0A8D0HUW4_PIG